MRTNELHASAKVIQRSQGRSSVAAAAYRAGVRLYDERTGLWHDYTKKQGVEHTRIYIPEGAPDWARDRGSLWNGAESKENRKNSATAREFEIAFPHEFNPLQRREAGDAIARELMRRYGCAVDIAYHAPNKDGDERNFHAHILFTGRAFDASRPDGWAKTRYRDLNNDPITVDGEKTTRSQQEILSLREFTAQTMNAIAKRDGLDVKTEHLSFEARGLDKAPSKKLGPAAADMERRGESSDRGDVNREIEAANDNLAALRDEKKVIDLEIEREKRRIAQEQQQREARRKAAQKAQAEKRQREKQERADFHKRIEEDRKRAARQEFFEAKRRAEIERIEAFYTLDANKAALDAARAELARKQGFFARILGQTRKAEAHAEAMRHNYENAALRQREAIDAINKKYHYRAPEPAQRPAPVQPERQTSAEQDKSKREQAERARPAREAFEPSTRGQQDKAKETKAAWDLGQKRPAANENQPPSRPDGLLGTMRRPEDIQAAIKQQGWDTPKPDALSGLKAEYREQVLQPHREEQAKEPPDLDDGEAMENRPHIGHD